MKSAKLMHIAAIAVFALLAIPIPLAAQCTRCCFPYANVSVSPSTTEEGQAVVLTTVLFNCSAVWQVITAKVNVIPSLACASFPEAFSLHALVPPRQPRTVTYTLSAPKCEGAYTVKEVSSNAGGSATATLTVN